ncbi:MAG: NAD-dependent succinate-semialdehyde dehydrogenase [Bacteroidia bacterium]|nr:NAD-dependent succinate-semialdehyde dehydrogenase [Bacteroidia bacterium]MDW8302043.1 NAD-dependent succinate-semialdehyde dehydrogenase [Bacteroidia bacterium]
MKYQSISPLTQEIFFEVDILSNDTLEKYVEKSNSTFELWKNKTIEERVEVLPKLATLLHERKAELARLSAIEMGKPITEGIAEVEKCATLCEHYYNHAKDYAKPNIFDAQHSLHYVPMGIILSIMPWNFPYWQVFRAVIPTLVAGNVVLVKHAPNVPQCSLAIAKIFVDAGVEEGVYTNLFISHQQVSQLIADKRIKGISLTGSTRAGIAVATQAAQYLKKVVLELGGSDPLIVTKHANIENAIKVCIRSRFGNCGQSCIAAKRILVQSDIADKFIDLLLAQIKSLRVGNPLDPATQIGPMARKDLLETALSQLQDALEKGATCLVGGSCKDDNSNFLLPTLLTNVQPNMRVMQEEVFAPIASIYVFDEIDHAIEVANNTEYGLGASVWTQDRAEASYIASKLLAGNVFVNGLVRSDPKYPFGGIKLSGVGKELSYWGMQEFCYPILRADLTE